MAELSKFDELRLKTGRELAQLINHELDLGAREARLALAADPWTVAESHHLRAQRAYASVSRLIPLVDETTDGPAARLDARLTQLREMLDGWVRAERPLKSQEELHAVCC